MSEQTPAPGAKHALQRFYEEAGFLVYRRCMRVLHDQQDALEVAQWTFLRALEVDLDVSNRAQALTWLYTTASRRALTLIRNASTRRRLLERYPLELLPGGEADVEQRAVSRDLLLQALGQLDEDTALIVSVTWLQGLSNQRAAEQLGVSTRTVIRARKHFERTLIDISGEAA